MKWTGPKLPPGVIDSARDGVMDRPFTPDSLAERWGCSGAHIRNQINAGVIPCFRVGKLVRILAPWVYAFEQGDMGEAGINGTDAPTQDGSSEGPPPRRPTVTSRGVVG